MDARIDPPRARARTDPVVSSGLTVPQGPPRSLCPLQCTGTPLTACGAGVAVCSFWISTLTKLKRGIGFKLYPHQRRSRGDASLMGPFYPLIFDPGPRTSSPSDTRLAQWSGQRTLVASSRNGRPEPRFTFRELTHSPISHPCEEIALLQRKLRETILLSPAFC